MPHFNHVPVGNERQCLRDLDSRVARMERDIELAERAANGQRQRRKDALPKRDPFRKLNSADSPGYDASTSASAMNKSMYASTPSPARENHLVKTTPSNHSHGSLMPCASN